MLAVGPMMVEHRLIERMITLVADEARRIRATGRVRADFALSAVDFFRTYADRCHHGKEEGILFRELKLKSLSPEHRDLMAELEAEHVLGRETVRKLLIAQDRFLKGDRSAPSELAALMERLAAFYPRHIDKEDHHFFQPCMDYFTPGESDRMLEECREFDRTLVHRLFEGTVLELEGPPPSAAAAALEGAPTGLHTCMMCGYTYDPRQGDPTGKVPPGVPFEALPKDWVCPQCHASKRAFIPAKG